MNSMMVGPSQCEPLGGGRYHESYLEKDDAVGRGDLTILYFRLSGVETGRRSYGKFQLMPTESFGDYRGFISCKARIWSWQFFGC